MSILYKIDGAVVFYGTNLDPSVSLELNEGTKIGYGLEGEAMVGEYARQQYFSYCDRTLGQNCSEQVKANIAMAPVLVSIVREEMISVSLSALGLSALTMMNKLSPVIMAIQIGMFEEAVYILQNMATDAFLTTDRIAKYVSLLVSCNAIP